ncbi:hypothetical protein COCCU_01060 [Corynebacterium occultum]|uniref:Secreted protein n=1 Tax=Corynebacterium occultum TaxID=2675219 RepID=A0A6B8W891_9CORY|nr:hypothetical protein [Corynebacterium occultum]QGU06180.1 hypothetical protein COCCU_01060 [Corynebacterium occultum]
MPQYRFSPTRAGKLWCAIFAVAALLFALPGILNLLTPEREAGTDEIRLGSLGYDWEMLLHDEQGEVISCSKSSNVILGYLWDCDGTLIQSLLVEGVEDEEVTLRRMMRANLAEFPPEDAPVFREGDARMVIDPRYGAVGMSLAGSDEREGQSMIVLVHGGPEVPELADAVWFQFSRQPLPTPVLLLLDDITPSVPENDFGFLEELQMENV